MQPKAGTMVLGVPGRAQAWAQTAAVVSAEPRDAEEASIVEAQWTEASGEVEGSRIG